MTVDSVSGYLAISKDEQSYVDKFATNDLATKRGIAALTSKARTLGSPAALLGDRQSLEVMLQAFNMSADITHTAVLKALLTQDPAAPKSLAVTSGNSKFKAFASFMANVNTIVVGLAPSAALALTTAGATASSITVQNTAFSNPTGQSAAHVGKQWDFVLNDGKANQSIQSALAAVAGKGASYTINTDGSVTVSSGAPPVTVTKDSVGDAIYTLALAADTNGNVVSQASVTSVTVAAGTTTADKAGQVDAMLASMRRAGFGATQDSSGSLAITGQSINAAASAASAIVTTFPGVTAVATAATTTTDQVLALGSAGLGLQAGQVVHDGRATLGIVQSVDSFGNVTLAAPATAAVARGDYLNVDALVKSGVLASATAASVSGFDFQAVTTTQITTSDNVIALGSAAASLRAGQVLMNGKTVIGTIASVDSDGTVTLERNSTTPIKAGTTVTVAATATAATTPALQNAGRLAAGIVEYKTNQYEQAQSSSNPGMHEALYFTRSINKVSNINQLMSDPALLSVITTNLGLPKAFGNLSFDQQTRILVKAVDFSKFSDPAFVKKSAERYLSNMALSQTTAAPTGTLALFGAGEDAGQAMLAAIGGQSLTTSSSGNQALQLYA